MCIRIKQSAVLDHDVVAFKEVQKFPMSGEFYSLYPKEQRSQQRGIKLPDDSSGTMVKYKIGQTMEDKKGVGFYVYAFDNYQANDVLSGSFSSMYGKRYRGWPWISILVVIIPKGTKVHFGVDLLGKPSIIAKKLTVVAECAPNKTVQLPTLQ